jgi:hypothetical protein
LAVWLEVKSNYLTGHMQDTSWPIWDWETWEIKWMNAELPTSEWIHLGQSSKKSRLNKVNANILLSR